MLEIEGEHPDKLLHRATTEAIIGATFEVHRELGYGFLERVYQRALQVELKRRGVAAEIERRIQVQYKGVIVGDYDDPATKALRRAVYTRSLANKIVRRLAPNIALPGGHPAAGKGLVGGKPALYVCRNMACEAPVTDPEALRL